MLIFFSLGFASSKAGLPIQSIGVKEKEEEKDEKHTGNCLEKAEKQKICL